MMLHSRPSLNTHYFLLLTLRRKYSMFLDDFPNSLEGKDDQIITEEDAEDISKTVEDEQRHLEDMDDLNLDDLNRKKRSVEAVDNTTSTTNSKDTHNFYQLLRFIQNEGLEGKYFIQNEGLEGKYFIQNEGLEGKYFIQNEGLEGKYFIQNEGLEGKYSERRIGR